MTIHDHELAAEAVPVVDAIACLLTDVLRSHQEHDDGRHACGCVAFRAAVDELRPYDALEATKRLMDDDQRAQFGQLAGKLRSIIAADYDLSHLQGLPTVAHPEGSN